MPAIKYSEDIEDILQPLNLNEQNVIIMLVNEIKTLLEEGGFD